jgi:phosphate acetyltransferase
VSLIDDIVARARGLRRRIAFPESDDPRVVEAASRLAADGVVQPILVGPAPLGVPAGVGHADPETSSRIEAYARDYLELTSQRGTSPEEAGRSAREPLTHAALMVRSGDADGSVAGARHTTAETLRAALRVIRPREEIRTVSTFFLMVHPDLTLGHEGAFIFADCGLVEEPSAPQLAEIALMSAETAQRLLGVDPRVALLSYSTRGSADHPCLRRVREALQILQARAPGLCVDGELQVDAAIVPEVAAAKAPESPVAGRANVLIFPDLDSGNIGYKLVQRFGGARALGPITQGLQRPANDLSRGCSVEDVYEVAAITALQAAGEDAA